MKTVVDRQNVSENLSAEILSNLNLCEGQLKNISLRIS